MTGYVTKVNKTDSGYKVSVRVPTVKRPVDVMLAEGTQLDVNIADLSLVKQGDRLEIIRGQAIRSSRMGMMVTATEARVTPLPPPLAGVDEEGRPRQGRTANGKKAGAISAGPETQGAAKPDAQKTPSPKTTTSNDFFAPIVTFLWGACLLHARDRAAIEPRGCEHPHPTRCY